MSTINKDEDTLLDMFAAHALSGCVRDGLSIIDRREQALDIAEACYVLAGAMLAVRSRVRDMAETL